MYGRDGERPSNTGDEMTPPHENVVPLFEGVAAEAATGQVSGAELPDLSVKSELAVRDANLRVRIAVHLVSENVRVHRSTMGSVRRHLEGRTPGTHHRGAEIVCNFSGGDLVRANTDSLREFAEQLKRSLGHAATGDVDIRLINLNARDPQEVAITQL